VTVLQSFTQHHIEHEKHIGDEHVSTLQFELQRANEDS